MKPVGYFEGESMTRRRVFAVAGQALGGGAAAVIVLPALGFAIAPIFDEPEENWQAVGKTGEFTAETYLARVITIVEGIGEAGKTTVYVRQGSPELVKNKETGTMESADEYIAISTRCAHLGCPVKFVQAAGQLHLPLPRRRLRLLRRGHRRPAGPPARPVPDASRRRHRRDRAPLQRHLPARADPRPRPGRVHRGHLGVSVPAPPIDRTRPLR